VAVSDLFGLAGTALLDRLDLPEAFCTRVASLRDLITVYDREITGLDRRIAGRLDGHAGYGAIEVIPGVARCWPRCSWLRSATWLASPGPSSCARGPGLTPRHRESDTKVHRVHITKQGPVLVRTAPCPTTSEAKP
jgi:hypothetical protein